MHDEHAALISAAAQANAIDPDLLHAIIDVESGGNPAAVSRARAKGLMQINPITQKHLGVEDPHDPEESVHAGARYLRELHDRFKDPHLTLAAYNAGPGAVRKYNGIPPFPETQNYVTKVKDQLEALRQRKDIENAEAIKSSVYAPDDVGFSNPIAALGRMMGF